MKLKKYLLIAKSIIDQTFAYRVNFMMWRVRVNFQLLTMYYLWLALLPQNTTLFGYNRSLMLTYIFFGAIVGDIVFSTRAAAVGDEINNGNLSNYLIRPMNYFLSLAAVDVGDKLMNIGFAAVELTILFLLLRPPFFLQTNLLIIFLTILGIIFATVIEFFINILLGTIGFWSNEVWAPRFIFTILLQFFSGGLFPLDILPKGVYNFFQATPFPYLLYFPTKIYLGQLNIQTIYQGLLISFIWMFVMYGILKFVWGIGIKSYTAQGR